MTKIASPGYCSCFFDVFKDVFKDADITMKPTDAQLLTVKQRTATTCNPKLTEDEVKQAFNTTCVVGDNRNAPYCTCAWTAFRKKLDLPDFVSDFTGPKFDDAKKNVSTTCKGKLPDDVAKANFMRGCTAQAPGASKTCECVWKKLRAKASTEDITVGLVDIKPADIDACKKP
jgi:hypothetical protein